MNITLTLTEEMLGTKAADKDVFATYIASKHPEGTAQRDELENAERIEEIGSSVFHRDEQGRVGIYDYQVKGFFKDAAAALNRADKDMRGGLEKLSAYKTKIDQTIFIKQRFIPIVFPAGGSMGVCERPLRAETAQGPRVALARSETVPAGSQLHFDVVCMSKELVPYIQAWFAYGALRGLGQWRNSGKGRFVTQ